MIVRDLRDPGSWPDLPHRPSDCFLVDAEGHAWPDSVPSWREYERLLQEHERKQG